MSARFFADETDIGLARALDDHCGGVVHPGHPNLPEVPRGTNDDSWLEVIGRRVTRHPRRCRTSTNDDSWLEVIGRLGLVVVSRDGRIRYRPVEKSLWVRYRIRGFVLTGKGSQSTEESLAILTKYWSKISDLVDAGRLGPWMYSVTRSGLREIDLRA